MTLYATPLGQLGPPEIRQGFRDENGILHGTISSYRRPCHCDPCRQANREHRQRWRDKAKAEAPAPAPVTLDMSWADRGACRNHPDLDKSAWFPQGQKVTNPNLQAERVCRNVCPVRAQCEQYGRDHDEFGIWGGVRLLGPYVRRR